MAKPTFLDSILARIRRPRVAPTDTAGAPGTAIYGGYIAENEKNAKLAGREKYVTYSNLLANISIVAASVRYSLNLIAKAGWTVQPAGGDGVNEAEAQRLADLLQDIIDDMDTPWFRVVRRAAMFRFYGFSIQEWTAKKRDDGVFGFKDIAPRPQSTIYQWDTMTDGTVAGVVQRNPQNSADLYLPRRKLVYLVDDSINDSPEGMGLFRHLAEPAQRLERMQQLEGFNYEMDLRGVPIGRAPIAEMRRSEKSDAEITEELNTLTNFMKKHIKNPQLGIVLDSMVYATTDEREAPSGQRQWDLEVLNGGSAESGAAVASAIERLNREMARIMGTEGLLLGGDGRGSLALSRDKTDQFALITDSTLTEIRESMNKDVVDVVWMLNGWPDELKPRLITEQIQYRDIEQVTGALADMAKSGAMLAPNDPAINVVRTLLGLPDQPELDDETLTLMGLPNPNDPQAGANPSAKDGASGNDDDTRDMDDEEEQ